MYIEKVFVQNNIGPLVIPMVPNVDRDVYYSEDVTFFIDDKDDSNHYTYIIGDNGAGKTTLLNCIANIYHNSIMKMQYRGHQDNVKKPLIKYVGAGLYSADNEFEELDVRMVNPNRMSVSRQIVNLFYQYSEKIDLLEHVLNKHFIPNFSLYVNYHKISQKQSCSIGINNDVVTKAILAAILKIHPNSNDPFFYLVVNKIERSEYKQLLELHYGSIKQAAQQIFQNSVSLQLREVLKSLKFNLEENLVSTRGWKSRLSSLFYKINGLYYTEKESLLVAMFLDECGIIRNGIECEFSNGVCNVNSLSTGEKVIIKTFSYFAEITEKKRSNIIFLCDEPENSLHPTWQKEFPDLFRKIVEEVYHIKGSHFIFTTHSPLIIMKAASIPNTFVLCMSRDAMNRVNVEEIYDVPRFSIERVLFDVFSCPYYTNREFEENDENTQREIEKRKDRELVANLEDIENINKLLEINNSFNSINTIDSLYKKLFENEIY